MVTMGRPEPTDTSTVYTIEQPNNLIMPFVSRCRLKGGTRTSSEHIQLMYKYASQLNGAIDAGEITSKRLGGSFTIRKV